MKVQLKNAKPASEIQLSDAAFGRVYNEALVHQVVTAYMAAGRSGTKAQKTRAEVRGGGKKPWSQKGTGQARAGSIRSPIWVGGGRAFAAKPRDFSQKVNRKMYRAAMQTMVSQLVRDDRLVAVESIELSAPRTKLLISKLAEFGLSRALILVEAYEEQAVKFTQRPGLETLKFLLAENDLTASDLSRLLGTDISLGYRILDGERNLTTKHIKKLARHFHVGPEVFL